ncbi:hypothetical protein [Streptomyces sp. NPDC048277]|uniref:hypothetical protein n=1 Tax=Streptomyces sp. NPDC048277 TaxID=3155027 RepID=UPI0033CC2F08
MQSEVDGSYDAAELGHEYWVALPAPANTSGQPLSVLGATLRSAPKGVRILGYRAVSAHDTEGQLMGVALIGAEKGILERSHNYAGQPVVVKPHQRSDVYYLARIKVTGPVHGKLTTCRFRYRQGARTFRQDLRCVNEIKIGTP